MPHHEDDDGDDADSESHPLGRTESFPQDQHTQQGRDEGVDKVPHRGVKDVTGIDGPDVEGPVDQDQVAGQHETPQTAAVVG